MQVSPWVRELAVDIEVAIREFLERHPRTSRADIRRAMRIASRRMGVAWAWVDRRARREKEEPP